MSVFNFKKFTGLWHLQIWVSLFNIQEFLNKIATSPVPVQPQTVGCSILIQASGK